MPVFVLLRAGLLAGALAGAVAAHAATATAATSAAPALPAIEHFFDNPAFSGALLSPSGRYLAAVLGSHGQRDRLVAVDLADNHATVLAQFADADVGQVQWVNDERLLFNTADKNVGQRDARYGPGLFAVNRDGKGFRQLVMRNDPFVKNGNSGRELLPWHTFMLDQPGAQDSDEVYVEDAAVAQGRKLSSDLLRLNTVTGRIRELEKVEHSQRWLLDQHGVPRLTMTLDKNLAAILYRDPASNAWRTLAAFDGYLGGAGAFAPVGFGDGDALYVISHAGHDKSALYRYDLASNKLATQPLIMLGEFDFQGQLIVRDGKLLGARVLSDARSTVWFDAAMKALQQRIDKLLPYTANLVSVPARPQTPWVLVESYSDHQPRKYLVFNTDTGRLSEVGNTQPAIVPEQMGTADLVHYKARDGLTIPAWLTLPAKGGRHLPMVVLVHGGPNARGGDWSWHADAQFLASRGYAVLEPEYRGSTGYGDAHFRAGWKQWGLAMQDDIADGARWAIAQGTADPKRICIAGASYGGYATLMGLVRNPELFRCGVEWAGVTDINLMYDGSWFYSSDLSQEWKQYGMPTLIGDQVKDAEQLKATSPLLLADKIRQPLLLAYGGADQRVPLNHGLKFRDAVKAGNPDVEWIEYPEEGHGWALPKNRIDFWGRVEAFLAKYNPSQAD